MDAVRFLVINPENEERQFKIKRGVNHRRMMTLDPAAMDDTKSISASALNNIWDKHIETIQFGDHTSKASSKV